MRFMLQKEMRVLALPINQKRLAPFGSSPACGGGGEGAKRTEVISRSFRKSLRARLRPRLFASRVFAFLETVGRRECRRLFFERFGGARMGARKIFLDEIACFGLRKINAFALRLAQCAHVIF